MIGHAQIANLIPQLPFIRDTLPAAIIIFFVLSGYIIESTTQKDAGVKTYAIHRMARMYSVALPAVILSLACIIGFAIVSGPAEIEQLMASWSQLWQIPVILMFRGEDWFSELELFWNGPFWSLHFEVAYYIVYGFLLLPASRTRALAVGAFLLLIGPKIILLFPCWWIGVELARRPSLRFPGPRSALAALFLSPVIIAVIVHLKLGETFLYALESLFPWYHLLGHAEPFLVYYVIALLVCMNFVAARQLHSGIGRALRKARQFIHGIAGYTFSIYLFHRPLQNLIAHFYTARTGDTFITVSIQIGILAIIFLIGSFTERRAKHLRVVISHFVDRQGHDRQQPV